MQISVRLKLDTTKKQREALVDTMRAFNALCTDIALNHPDDTNRFVLQRLIYRETIKFTSLSSQFVIKAITRVAGANKTRKAQLKSKKLPRKKRPATHCSFARFSAVPYDARLLNMSSLLSAGTVSIASLTGRQKVKVCLDSRNLGVLLSGKIAGGALLVRSRRGGLSLVLVVDVPEPQSIPAADVLGVDMGVVNIAVCSDGTAFLSDRVESARQRYARARKSLQEKGTRSAKRRLKKIGARERRFRRDVNHCISKQIVAHAEGTKSAIALEDLSGINARVTVRKNMRARRLGWSFSQLRFFIEYKAKLHGVNVLAVPPAYTSQTCPVCGHADRKNRPSQDAFVCRSCGFEGNADYVASLNIRTLGIKILESMMPQPAQSAGLLPGACQCARNVAPSIEATVDNIEGAPLKGTDVNLNASAPGSYKPAISIVGN